MRCCRSLPSLAVILGLGIAIAYRMVAGGVPGSMRSAAMSVARPAALHAIGSSAGQARVERDGRRMRVDALPPPLPPGPPEPPLPWLPSQLNPANAVRALAETWASDPQAFAMDASRLVQDHAGSALDAVLPAQQGAWTPAGHMHDPRFRYSLISLRDGRVLAVGAGDGRSCELYDPRKDSWSATGRMAVARTLPTTTLLADGRVLVTGGYWLNRSAEVYDPVTGGWSAAGDMATPRWGHAAALLRDGRVLVVAGDDSAGHLLASAEIWDPSTRSFTTVRPLHVAREGATATGLPDGTVLVAGGYGMGEQFAYLRSTEIYNPALNLWTDGGRMRLGRYFHTATLLPKTGEVVVTGGFFGGSVSVTEVYTPAAHLWRTVNDLHDARWWHTATALPDGRLLVTGGTESEGPGRARLLATTELLDPVTGHWSNGPPLSTGRQLHAAALLPDGRVLVAGGVDLPGPLASAELLRLPRPSAMARASDVAVPPSARLLGSTVEALRGSYLLAVTSLEARRRDVSATTV